MSGRRRVRALNSEVQALSDALVSNLSNNEIVDYLTLFLEVPRAEVEDVVMRYTKDAFTQNVLLFDGAAMFINVLLEDHPSQEMVPPLDFFESSVDYTLDVRADRALMISPWGMDIPVSMGEVCIASIAIHRTFVGCSFTVGQVATLLSEVRQMFFLLSGGIVYRHHHEWATDMEEDLAPYLFEKKPRLAARPNLYHKMGGLCYTLIKMSRRGHVPGAENHILLWSWVLGMFGYSAANAELNSTERDRLAAMLIGMESFVEEVGMSEMARFMLEGAFDLDLIRLGLSDDVDPSLVAALAR